MTNQPPDLPSLLDAVREQSQPPSVRPSLSPSRVLVSLFVDHLWWAYLLVLLVSWVVLPSYLAGVALWWIVSLFVTLVGFKSLRIVGQARRRRRLSAENQIAGSAVDRFEDIFSRLTECGYESVARDCRVIVRSTQAYGSSSNGILSIIDESLRFYLTYLLKVVSVIEVLNGDTRLNANDKKHDGPDKRVKKKIHDKLRKKWKHRAHFSEHALSFEGFFVGESSTFSGIRIGPLEIGEGLDFEGIRIGGVLVIGQHRGKNMGINVPPQGEVVPVRPAELPAHFSELEKAAAHAEQEIRQLRAQCEKLLVESLSGDFERTTEEIRARLQRERRVIEEMKKF